MTRRTYSDEFRARAVRQVEAALPDAASRWDAVRTVAGRIGVSPRTLVTWVSPPAEPGASTNERRPPGRPAGTLGADTRALVLEVAQQTIAELGSAASVRLIAERCGLSGNALYHYFPSKAALVAAVTERNYEEFFGHLSVAAASGDSLAEDLARVVGALEEFLAERPWFPLVLARSLPGVYRRRAPMPPAASRLVDLIEARAIERAELRHEDRDRLEGVVAVILMGLTLSGPSVREVAFDSVRWMLEEFWPGVSATARLTTGAASRSAAPATATPADPSTAGGQDGH